MAGRITFRIGVDLKALDREIVAHCDAAVAAIARGESVEARRDICFESWATFFRCMTAERIEILEHVVAHDVVASTEALALALDRDHAAVQADVEALLEHRLLERDGDALRYEPDPDDEAIRTIGHG